MKKPHNVRRIVRLRQDPTGTFFSTGNFRRLTKFNQQAKKPEPPEPESAEEPTP